MGNRANLYHYVLIQVNIYVTNSLRWGQTLPRGGLKGKELQSWTTPRECKDQWKMQKNYFQKSAGFLHFYKKLFPRLLTLFVSQNMVSTKPFYGAESLDNISKVFKT